MKLYAKVVGLKQGKYVEKGQGSNQSLSIEVLAEGLDGIPTRSNIYRLSLNVGNNNKLEAELLDYSSGRTIRLVDSPYFGGKGEKQKGESRHMDPATGASLKHCPTCHRE